MGEIIDRSHMGELLAVRRAIIMAKFQANPLLEELMYSDFIANVLRRIDEALFKENNRIGRSDLTVAIKNSNKMDENHPFWKIIIDFLTSELKRLETNPGNFDKHLENICLPFRLEEDQIKQIKKILNSPIIKP